MNNHLFIMVRIGLLIVAIVIASGNDVFAGVEEIIADIEKIGNLESEEFSAMADSIFSRVQQDTTGVTAAIVPRLTAPGVGEKSLCIYIAVLGTIRSFEAIGAICDVAQHSESLLVRQSCWAALLSIGDEQSRKCLLDALDYVTDPDERFLIFNQLATLQVAACLPLTGEILASDPTEYYWRPMFVFGKLGDVAVPFLLERINDSDVNVRYNAVWALRMLLPPVALQPLQDRFWEENDDGVKIGILNALESINPDIESSMAFLKQAKDKSKGEVKQYAEECIENIRQLSDQLKTVEEMKQESSEKFDEAYRQIWDSYGNTGDYKMLYITSSVADEPRLKKLGARILMRNSDEALDDYDAINGVIIMNRVLEIREGNK